MNGLSKISKICVGNIIYFVFDLCSDSKTVIYLNAYDADVKLSASSVYFAFIIEIICPYFGGSKIAQDIFKNSAM